MRARHILVASKEKARELYEKIAHGAEFGDLARQYSNDPGSKEQGGDLGFFVRGQMVPQFEDAAFSLKPGEVSQPFQTQFGWHIIKVDARRERQLPPYDAIKDRVRGAVIHRKAQQLVGELRNTAQVEYVDPEIRKEVERPETVRPRKRRDGPARKLSNSALRNSAGSRWNNGQNGPKPSPFAPASLAALPPIEGVAFATCEAGIRYKGRTDLMLARFEPGTTVAGVLTQSKTCSAPVLWCRQSLKGGRARVLVVNSGNANAFTGKRGTEATRITAEAAAKTAGCKPGEVFVASTGVIGEPLDASRFVHLLDGLAAVAAADTATAAARAIMTTDTYPKLATARVEIDGVPVTLNGFCKGAGMIAPDMATMLGFIFTDAAWRRRPCRP